jgi:hypothetical protein
VIPTAFCQSLEKLLSHPTVPEHRILPSYGGIHLVCISTHTSDVVHINIPCHNLVRRSFECRRDHAFAVRLLAADCCQCSYACIVVESGEWVVEGEGWNAVRLYFALRSAGPAVANVNEEYEKENENGGSGV